MADTTTSPVSLKRLKTLAITMIVLGIAMILFPVFSTKAVVLYTGWVLMMGGAIITGGSLVDRRTAGWWPVVIGVLATLTGLLMVTHLLNSVLAISSIVVIWLFIDGFIGALAAVAERKDGWKIQLFFSLLTLGLAIALWAHFPNSSTWLIGTFAGISMLLRGLSVLSLASLASASGQESANG